MPASTTLGDPARRRAVLRRRAAILVALGLAWLAAGVRHLDPRAEFGVLDGPLLAGAVRRVEGAWALAPPGLVRLTRYPRIGLELPLPGAEETLLPAPDGTRFGFRGFLTVRVREESWHTLHRAARGAGLRATVVGALRRSAAGVAPGRGGGPPSAAQSRALEGRLRDELDALGLDLRRLEFEGFDVLSAAAAPAGPATARLLVVGLDGADWAVLDPLLEQGRMPHLRALIERGVRAKLLTISPMLSPVVWTSVATGVEPSRHGVLDFLVDAPGGGARQPVTSAQRRVPTVWEILSRSGVEVGVVGWWASWPADAVRGYLVADRVAYQLFGYRADPSDPRGKTWPPDLYDEIRPLIVPPDDVAWDEVLPYLSGERLRPQQFDAEERAMLDELRTLLASGRTYVALGAELRRRFEPQLEVLYFEGTDTIGHLFMPYRAPAREGVDPRRAASFGGAVDRYYETVDAMLGQALAGRGPEWTVIVLSDHGFASDATRPRTTDSRIGHGGAADWHRRFGMLVLSGAHVAAGVELAEASVYDIAPTVLALFGQPVPRSWPGRVLAQALAPEHLAEHPVRFRDDDPAREALRAGTADDDPAATDLIQKLQGLGYLSASGAAAGPTGESITAPNNSGVAFLAEGRFADAERAFRAGLATAPGTPILQLNLGVSLRLQGRDAEAEASLAQALEAPETQRVAGQVLAQMRLDQGDAAGAEDLVQRVLAREPEAAEARNLLGWIFERRGRLAEARAEYERAAELDPDVAMPRNNLGSLARGAGHDEEAEQWYLRAIEADPYFMPAYNNLALVYQDRGEMERALDLYDRALAKAPENAELLNNVGSWYFAVGDYDQAERLWNQATERDPEYPSPLNNLAGLAITRQRLDAAESLLRRALALQPGYGDARINLALVHHRRGAIGPARDELRRATEDHAAAPRAWTQLGLLELEQRRPAGALAALERASALAPQDFSVWSALGEACRQSGDRARAAEAWRRSLELNPQQERLRASLAELERG